MDVKELAEVVSAGEGPELEFKRSRSGNLGRELCAFANAAGGRLLIGVDDSGHICGVAEHNRLKSDMECVCACVCELPGYVSNVFRPPHGCSVLILVPIKNDQPHSLCVVSEEMSLSLYLVTTWYINVSNLCRYLRKNY